MVEHELGHTNSHDDGTRGHGRHHTHQERHVVPASDTVVQPLAVMVEATDALVANTAVFGPRPRSLDVAQMTPAVFDYVRVFGAVELWHERGVF